jgi:hypothetical protein
MLGSMTNIPFSCSFCPEILAGLCSVICPLNGPIDTGPECNGGADAKTSGHEQVPVEAS